MTALALQFVLRKAIIDSFRQRIFSIRRDALYLVAEGAVSADDPEYIFTDRYLNGLLHFAERFTFSRLIIGIRLYQHYQSSTPMNLIRPSSPDPLASEKLQRIRTRATDRLLWHIFETSPSAWFVVLVASPTILVKHRSDIRDAILSALARFLPSSKIEREVSVMTDDDCAVAA